MTETVGNNAGRMATNAVVFKEVFTTRCFCLHDIHFAGSDAPTRSTALINLVLCGNLSRVLSKVQLEFVNVFIPLSYIGNQNAT